MMPGNLGLWSRAFVYLRLVTEAKENEDVFVSSTMVACIVPVSTCGTPCVVTCTSLYMWNSLCGSLYQSLHVELPVW